MMKTNGPCGMSMADATGFLPIASADAQILILGSMPGLTSLQAGQYYAHPRNQFWNLLGELLHFDPHSPYATRKQALIDAHIALWDVLKFCHRPGSLDANIVAQSVVINDFMPFFESHPLLTTVFFNGATAEQMFRRHVPRSDLQRRLHFHRLPSTSPAHAGMTQAQKREHWQLLTETLSATAHYAPSSTS